MFFTIYDILGAYVFVNKLVHAQADGCRTGGIHPCSLDAGVCMHVALINEAQGV